MRPFLLKGLVVFALVLCGVSYFGYFGVSGVDSLRKSGDEQFMEGPGSLRDVGVEFSKDDALPFRFSTGDLSVKITKQDTNSARDAQYMLAHYKPCGPKYRPASYFPDVVKTMRKLPEVTYSIGDFQLVMMPNLLGYSNLPALQEDFFTCSGDTGTLVPLAMNEHWLVFGRSCKTENEQCLRIASIVTPTIQIK